MSVAALPAPASTAAADRRPSLGRLTVVELRKMTDTRAGFWLLLSTVLITAARSPSSCVVADAPDLSLQDMVALALQPASLLLPIVGILLVSSEWSQRTAMITFTLVPARSRVMVAKLLAALLLAIVAFQVAFAFAAVGTALGGGSWRYSAGLVGQVAVYTIVPMLTGVAFGAALRNPAPAIVGYFLLPIAFAALVASRRIDGIAPWLDQTRTTEPMLEPRLTAQEWARFGTSVALWLGVPLAIGWWRVVRSDVQ